MAICLSKCHCGCSVQCLQFSARLACSCCCCCCCCCCSSVLFSFLNLNVCHCCSVQCLQFISKTHMFFSCSQDGTIKQWDADSFELIATLQVCCYFFYIIYLDLLLCWIIYPLSSGLLHSIHNQELIPYRYASCCSCWDDTVQEGLRLWRFKSDQDEIWQESSTSTDRVSFWCHTFKI